MELVLCSECSLPALELDDLDMCVTCSTAELYFDPDKDPCTLCGHGRMMHDFGDPMTCSMGYPPVCMETGCDCNDYIAPT